MQAAKGIISNCDALIDFLESIGQFLNRLDIYIRIPPTPTMDKIVVKILVELISTLGLVTEELKQRKSSESVLACVSLFLTTAQPSWSRSFSRRKTSRRCLGGWTDSRKTRLGLPQLIHSLSFMDSSRI